LKAFTARSLADAAKFTGSMDFVFAEEGQTEFEGMGIDVTMKVAEKAAEAEETRRLEEGEDADAPSPQPVQPKMTVTWLAQEGKGEDLAEQFKQILKMIVKVYGVSTDAEVTATEGDKVSIRLSLPPPEEAPLVDAEQGFTPAFHASLWTGRSFTEMYDKRADNLLTLPKGVKGHGDVAIRSAIFQVFKGEFDEMHADKENRPNSDHIDENGYSQMDLSAVMGVVSSAKVVQDFRYRTAEDLAGAATFLPTFDYAVEQAKDILKHMVPGDILDPLKGLSDLADGLASMEMIDLLHDYMIIVSFTNVHLTPVLTSVLTEEH